MEYDDDEDCVSIGTPFDLPEENEPLPKASKIEDQVATDEKGRRRFHGAFTGGFSAGYFNTVGSKEGWSPASFKSSRSKKNDSEQDTRHVFKPEDFMDEEDFADHGIAPKKLKTAVSTLTENEFDAADSTSLTGSRDPLIELLAPPKISVGIQLLKKMGWKHGQGIGEMVELNVEKEDIVARKKVYGCALPPSVVQSKDIQSFAMMLAPKDMLPITFKQKDNFHGIGYSGIVTVQTMLAGSENQTNSKKGFRPSGKEKNGIRGQAFGVGVYEEEDDDIYAESALSNYDLTMCDDIDEKDGWTGTMIKPTKSKGYLAGFMKSTKKVKNILIPFLIEIPPMVPQHIFNSDKEKTLVDHNVNTNDCSKTSRVISSHERSNLLGEATKGMEDIKHWTLKWDKSDSVNKTNERPSLKTDTSEIFVNATDIEKSKCSRWDSDVAQIKPKQKIDHSTVTKKQSGIFQPFLANPKKQERYEIYLESIKKKCKPVFKYDTSVTEWEKEQEMSEFSRAAALYRPLTSTIANRFVHANLTENKGASLSDKPVDKNAAEMGMHGSLTRTVLDWYPDSVLCKRMNIPNPYPSALVKGVPERNKKKCSFFSSNSDIKNIIKPDTSKDDVEEDDLLSQIQKNKQKRKNNVGPLSHLNIKIDSKRFNENSKGPNISSTSTKVEEKEDIVKPSIDIFRAIFENSDSENSDDGCNSEKEETQNTCDTPNIENTLNIKKNNISEISPKLTPCIKNDDFKKSLPLAFLNSNTSLENVPRENTMFSMAKQPSSELYEKNKAESNTNVVEKHSDTKKSADSPYDPSVSKNDVKSKHKKMKKEKKMKKHKKKRHASEDSDSDMSQKYKNRKKKKYRSDESDDIESGENYMEEKKYINRLDRNRDSNKNYKKKRSKKHRNSSSSSSDNSALPSNAVLVEKLKQLSRRPTAADFM